MDQATFSDKSVAAALNEDFYAVKFNAEQREPIEFNGKTYKFVNNGRRGSHELAQMLLQGRMGYPTVVFLNEKAEVIQPVPGFQAAEPFERIVTYFGDDLYKSVPWTEYEKS
jgi:thioredoxin-related protein